MRMYLKTIFLLLMFCGIVKGNYLFANATDAQMQRRISQIKKAADQVHQNSKKLRARIEESHKFLRDSIGWDVELAEKLNKLKLVNTTYDETILAFKTEVSRLRSEVDSMNMYIEDAPRKIAILDHEIKSYKEENEKYQKSLDLLLEQNKILREELTKLLQHNADLDRDITQHEYDNRELNYITSESLIVKNNIEYLKSMFVHIEEKNLLAHEKHIGWLKEFNILLEKYSPNFSEVSDLESYKTEYEKVLNLRSEVKFNEELRKAEYKAMFDIDKSIEKAQVIPNIITNIKDSVGFLIYNKYQTDNSSLLIDLQEYQRTSSLLIQSLNRVRLSIVKKQKTRRSLYFDVPKIWQAILNAKLAQHGISIADGIIRDGIIAIDSAKIYFKLKNDFEALSQKSNKHLFRVFLPSFSRRFALQGLELTYEVEDKISSGEIPSTEITRSSALIPLIMDYRGIFKNSIRIAASYVGNEEFLLDRKSIVERLLRRNSDKYSAACIELGNKIVRGEKPDLQSEKDFKEFREQCR